MYRPYSPIELGDTARVAKPSDAIEYRLGTVTAVHFAAAHTTFVCQFTLRFPNGIERTYPAKQVTRCTRADDRATIEAAFTTAYDALRDACRVAHDFDADLHSGTASLLRRLVDLASLRLGMTLDPADPHGRKATPRPEAE